MAVSKRDPVVPRDLSVLILGLHPGEQLVADVTGPPDLPPGSLDASRVPRF
jgi:hypothetical protein